jgi:ribosomal protein S18 acetylase RimI-like enzyme
LAEEGSASQEAQFVLKRLLDDREINRLKELLLPPFGDEYPGYDKWLDRAIEDCKKVPPERNSFGIFKEDGVSGSNPNRLIGAAILKMTASENAELKSLFIEEEFRKRTYGGRLYRLIEDHCKKRGISKIVTFVPDSEEGLKALNFLTRHGYKITGREELYNKGEYQYLMSKRLPESYNGDPYDWRSLCVWVIENCYNGKVTSEGKNDKDSEVIRFSFTPDVDNIPEISQYEIDCSALIFLEIGDLKSVKKIMGSERDISPCIVFARSFNEAQEIKDTFNVITLDENSVNHITSLESPKFKKEDIAGMIVEINPRNFKVIGMKEKFTYFKGGTNGRYLKENDYIYFFVRPTDENVVNQGGIRGRGRIKDLSIGSPIEEWEKYKEKSPIWNESEFLRFSSKTNEIMSIYIKDFELLPEIIYENLSSILEEPTYPEDLGHIYIDSHMLESLENASKEEEIKPLKKVDINIAIQDISENVDRINEEFAMKCEKGLFKDFDHSKFSRKCDDKDQFKSRINELSKRIDGMENKVLKKIVDHDLKDKASITALEAFLEQEIPTYDKKIILNLRGIVNVRTGSTKDTPELLSKGLKTLGIFNTLDEDNCELLWGNILIRFLESLKLLRVELKK